MDDWKEWSKYVIVSIEKLEKRIEKLESKHDLDIEKLKTKQTENNTNMKIDISTIKTRSSVYGAIAGLLISFILSIITGVMVWNITHSDITSKLKTGHIIQEQYFPPENILRKEKGRKC